MTRGVPAVTVTLLGGVAVRRDGTTVRMASTRPIALLAYLVVHAAALQRRDHLAAVFWPDTPDAQARTNLRR
jgi:DNA-binding SARP family transcriptional activator